MSNLTSCQRYKIAIRHLSPNNLQFSFWQCFLIVRKINIDSIRCKSNIICILFIENICALSSEIRSQSSSQKQATVLPQHMLPLSVHNKLSVIQQHCILSLEICCLFLASRQLLIIFFGVLKSVEKNKNTARLFTKKLDFQFFFILNSSKLENSVGKFPSFRFPQGALQHSDNNKNSIKTRLIIIDYVQADLCMCVLGRVLHSLFSSLFSSVFI